MRNTFIPTDAFARIVVDPALKRAGFYVGRNTSEEEAVLVQYLLGKNNVECYSLKNGGVLFVSPSITGQKKINLLSQYCAMNQINGTSADTDTTTRAEPSAKETNTGAKANTGGKTDARREVKHEDIVIEVYGPMSLQEAMNFIRENINGSSAKETNTGAKTHTAKGECNDSNLLKLLGLLGWLLS